MPRSRRRRVKDRRLEAEQRLAARRALLSSRKLEKEKMDRYIRAITRNHAGEIVRSNDGQLYLVQGDGSLVRTSNFPEKVEG